MTGLLKLKLFGLSTLVNVAIGGLLGGLLYGVWPDLYFRWYPSIPLFYWIMTLLMIYVLDRKKRKDGDVTITAFMVTRLCKFVLAVLFMWLYAGLVREHLKMFGITLMVFYFIYLVLETYTIYLFEKKRMKRERNNGQKSKL